MLSLLSIILSFCLLVCVSSLSPVPPRGINACTAIGCSPSNFVYTEQYVFKLVARLLTLGMSDAGYTYILLDDGWSNGRDAQGNLRADPTRFPSGIEFLSTYVRSFGLELGLSTDRGTTTRSGIPGTGSGGNFDRDAQLFAKWQINYLQVTSDSAFTDQQTAFMEYAAFYNSTHFYNPQVHFANAGGFQWYVPEAQKLLIGDSWLVNAPAQSWNDAIINSDLISHDFAYVGPKQGWADLGTVPHFATQPTLQAYTFSAIAAVTQSPLFLGLDLVQLNLTDLSEFMNPELLAVHSDVAGNGAQRMTAGSSAEIVAPLWSVNGCDSASPSQQWILGSSSTDPSIYTIESFARPGYCLWALQGHGSYCGSQNSLMFLASCNQTAVFCEKNNLWNFTSDGLLASAGNVGNYTSGPFATVDQVTCGSPQCEWGVISLQQAYPSNSSDTQRQQWSYDKQTQLLSNKAGVSAAATCLLAGESTTSNIYGKVLSDGSFIMLMVNNGGVAADLTCDTENCFSSANFPLKFPVRVRDIRNHIDLGTLTGGPFVQQVTGMGGAAIFQFWEL